MTLLREKLWETLFARANANASLYLRLMSRVGPVATQEKSQLRRIPESGGAGKLQGAGLSCSVEAFRAWFGMRGDSNAGRLAEWSDGREMGSTQTLANVSESSSNQEVIPQLCLVPQWQSAL